jgi:hypothetical protein
LSPVNPLLYPLTGMVLLTFVVLLVMALTRQLALRRGELRLSYFKLAQVSGAETVPDAVIKTTRHFANLFEMPVLFYAGGAVAIALGLRDWVLTDMAWGYLGFRALHSVIHLTTNNVMQRFGAFAASCALLLAFWLRMAMLA